MFLKLFFETRVTRDMACALEKMITAEVGVHT